LAARYPDVVSVENEILTRIQVNVDVITLVK
jgi:hypothetical protein